MGTVLCILSAVPLFIAVCLDGPDLLYVGAVCLLLVLAGVGGAVLVSGGVYWVAMDRLLEEDDYAPAGAAGRTASSVRSAGLYWLVVTAAYLLWTFGRGGTRSRRTHGSSGRSRGCSTARSWRSCAGFENEVLAGNRKRKMPQAAACGICDSYLGMLQRVLAGLETDDLVHRQREDEPCGVRAQAPGVADGVHDGGLFLARRDDDDELLFLLHGDAELAADALGILAASLEDRAAMAPALLAASMASLL